MSYDTLRQAVTNVLQTVVETKGFNNGRISLEEHPWGAEDIMTVSVVLDGKVIGAFILRLNFGRGFSGTDEQVYIDEIDLTTFVRWTRKFCPVLGGPAPSDNLSMGGFTNDLYGVLQDKLGPTMAELERQREATDLDARAQATRPRVVPQVIPAATGGFDLVLHGLTANDVLRAVEALPEVSQPGSSRTILDHLLADEL